MNTLFIILATGIAAAVVWAIVVGALDALRQGPLAIFRAPPRGNLEDIFGHWTEQDWKDAEANMDKEDAENGPWR